MHVAAAAAAIIINYSYMSEEYGLRLTNVHVATVLYEMYSNMVKDLLIYYIVMCCSK